MEEAIDAFMSQMKLKGTFVAGRLQAALVLIERVRESRKLDFESHRDAGSNGLLRHEYYAKLALDRFKITGVNRNSGRRSNHSGAWGPPLLALLAQHGFSSMSIEKQDQMLDAVEERFAVHVREISETAPIEVRLDGQTAESVIRDILKQADCRGKSGDVAQYLVAAKLETRLRIDLPLNPVNKRDHKRFDDTGARTGDFEIQDATIEVAIGGPDAKHLLQIEETLKGTDRQMWLLTRHEQVEKWRKALAALPDINKNRVVITSVESFVGQNIAEIGQFSAAHTAETFQNLFCRYNERWVAELGTPAMRIRIKIS